MKKNTVRTLIIMAILSIVVIFVGEGILRREAWSTTKWILSSPVQVALNGLIVFMFLMLFTGLLNSAWKSFVVVNLLYITGCIISVYKFIMGDQYVIPADVVLLGEAVSISKVLNIKLDSRVVIGVLLAIVLIIIVYKFDQQIFSKQQRGLIGGAGLILMLITIGGAGVMIYKSKQLTTPVTAKGQEENINELYDEKGFLVGFVEAVEDIVIVQPEGYSQERVEQILDSYLEKSASTFQKPNIIMIMSEAFFDINRLEQVEFSAEPIANFKAYQNQFVKGSIVTAIYGRNTCQTEYEVLTGHSVDFTDPYNNAYIRLVDENTPSIPKLLKEEGYQTMAIHSYEKKFFSRDTAYVNLGIDTYWASEDFEDPETARGYISDQEVTKKIIETYENKGKDPLFLHVVTMQNHMPYGNVYEANQITIQSDSLDEEESVILTTYANGINDSDKALKQLVEYLEGMNEPTVLVLYGDHMPKLGSQYEVYIDSGMITGSFDEEEYLQIHQTPFMIWNNYGLDTGDWGYLDASYLGSALLNYIGYDKDPYMNFLEDMRSKIKAYNEDFIIDDKGNIKSKEEISEMEEQLLENMWIVQYERLFGKETQVEALSK